MKRSIWLSREPIKREFCPQCGVMGHNCTCEADFYEQQQLEDFRREQEREADQLRADMDRFNSGEY